MKDIQQELREILNNLWGAALDASSLHDELTEAENVETGDKIYFNYKVRAKDQALEAINSLVRECRTAHEEADTYVGPLMRKQDNQRFLDRWMGKE